jgi:hypothetical protein
MPDYTSIRATTDAAAALREITFALTGQTRRRLSQSDALRAVCAVAMRHLDETAREVTGEGTGEQSGADSP